MQALNFSMRGVLGTRNKSKTHDCERNLSPMICNGNRTEWSPIQSVILRVITKSDDRATGVRFVYHEYDYRLN